MSYIRFTRSKTLVLTSLVVLLSVLVTCGTAAPDTSEDTADNQAGAPGGANTAPANDAASSEGTLRLAFGELGNQVMVPRMTSAFGKDPWCWPMTPW
jgi:hypothetical protein